MDLRFKIMEGITIYLERTRHFEKLKHSLEGFETVVKMPADLFLPPFNFLIHVDYLILTDISGLVADILLKEPYIAHESFKQVLNLAIKSQETEKNVKFGQAQIDIRVTLPLVPDILHNPKNHSPPRTGLFVIKGVITACTKVSKYCRSALYRCPLEGCVGQNGQRVFGDLMSASCCVHCGCVREEYVRARESGDQVLATFVNLDAFQSENSKYEGITVCLKDDLIKDLTLGVCYNVTVSHKLSRFIAWGIERTITDVPLQFSHNFSTLGIPQSVMTLAENIQKVCPNSPWALTAALSSLIASHHYPVNSFLHLKTSLLLSLASQSQERVPVPLLAVGPDCSTLLCFASRLSRRRLVVTSAALCGSLGVTASETCYEAGPLMLASGGVCYLGDWAKFGSGKASMASQIIAAVESDRVDLLTPSSTVGSSPPSLPLRAAVWTFWSGDKATNAAQAQLRTLIEVFGMPFIGDGGADIEAVADHLLYQNMHHEKGKLNEEVPEQDLKKYLNIVCSYKVELTSQARKLLRNYFVASRRERPDCLPLNSIKTMTALAEAHARLCLRTRVVYDDVVLVAFLYEEAITALYGPSLMSPPPSLFGMTKADNGWSVAEQMTVALKNFSVWLEQYIKSLLSEGSVNCSLPEE